MRTMRIYILVHELRHGVDVFPIADKEGLGPNKLPDPAEWVGPFDVKEE